MPEARRLFFALALPKPLQQQVITWRAESFAADAGRPVAAANLHMTLAFLGEISEQKASVLADIASRIQSPAFSMQLDDLGHWPRPGVVWLGSRRAPTALLQLASLLRSHAARNGCHQSTLPFHPHISLLRGATQPLALPASTPQWTLTVADFGLYESRFHQGRTRYQCLHSWPLVSSPPSPC